MATKIRLQRHGKKGRPFYHIVIADSRAPRDGKFIEKIGTYNPIPNPAEINLDLEKAVKWLQTGAQPTDTTRSILSYKGAMMKSHLLNGVRKGALTEAEAEAKFQAWLTQKEEKISGKISARDEAKRAEKNARLEAEKAVSDARAAELAKRRAEELAAAQPAENTEEGEAAAEEATQEEA
ncbi:MAG: 30S ribosomal protein S16 [Hyphomicrobiales bacterium]